MEGAFALPVAESPELRFYDEGRQASFSVSSDYV